MAVYTLLCMPSRVPFTFFRSHFGEHPLSLRFGLQLAFPSGRPNHLPSLRSAMAPFNSSRARPLATTSPARYTPAPQSAAATVISPSPQPLLANHHFSAHIVPAISSALKKGSLSASINSPKRTLPTRRAATVLAGTSKRLILTYANTIPCIPHPTPATNAAYVTTPVTMLQRSIISDRFRARNIQLAVAPRLLTMPATHRT